MLERTNVDVQPWDATEALRELHRKGYYPRSSRNAAASADVTEGISRWPEILRRCIEGGATLALSSFGAALFYLQRSLVGKSYKLLLQIHLPIKSELIFDNSFLIHRWSSRRRNFKHGQRESLCSAKQWD